MKKIICFGDTITEMGMVTESRGFVPRLAERYTRRADVLGRGFSGYTTREALAVLDEAVLREYPSCVCIAFGLNDSVLPNQFHHVPLDEYRRNLEDLASRAACSGAWIILVGPPPLDERKTNSREMRLTAQYANACEDAGDEMNLPVINLFQLIQDHDHWETKCLLDGIYLSASGMDILYEALVRELDQQFPLSTLPLLGMEQI